MSDEKGKYPRQSRGFRIGAAQSGLGGLRVRARALTFPDSIRLVLGNNGTLDVYSLVVRLRFLQSSIVTLQLACVATHDYEVLRADHCRKCQTTTATPAEPEASFGRLEVEHAETA
jgi:hypothetical protein